MTDNKTPLYQRHVGLGAKIVDFAGWKMPLMYTSIIEEHIWTRTKIGLFDVSHMGRLELSGPNVKGLLDRLSTRTVSDMEIGKSRYSLMCDDNGGVLDDMMISRLDNDRFYIVCNAVNREKIKGWIVKNAKDDNNAAEGFRIEDRTFDTAMIALQGPLVKEVAERYLPEEIQVLSRRELFSGKIFNTEVKVFRSGYTGEDGFEVEVPKEIAGFLWDYLLSLKIEGTDRVILPAGLGARDTLRLEAALPLYGHELTEDIDPISAGLSFAVDFSHDFIGKQALLRIKELSPQMVRVGLFLPDTQRAARCGFKIYSGNKVDQKIAPKADNSSGFAEECGYVTSGAFAPFIRKSIAMGYVKREYSSIGTELYIDISQKRFKAIVVKMPFYKREEKNRC